MTGWMILLHGRIKIVENAAKGEFLYKILGVFLCILFLKKTILAWKNTCKYCTLWYNVRSSKRRNKECQLA